MAWLAILAGIGDAPINSVVQQLAERRWSDACKFVVSQQIAKSLKQVFKRIACVPNSRDDIEVDEHPEQNVRLLFAIDVNVKIFMNGLEHSPRRPPFMVYMIREYSIHDWRDLSNNMLSSINELVGFRVITDALRKVSIQ